MQRYRKTQREMNNIYLLCPNPILFTTTTGARTFTTPRAPFTKHHYEKSGEMKTNPELEQPNNQNKKRKKEPKNRSRRSDWSRGCRWRLRQR
ncbi:hypothetical protein AVEN_114345-1 [Araneus ventricosus]|uniref:Uncharacterized protein n=1 Tax=Araneus ventricosus TaxID=182803 RepID=A0A4Y2UTX3_ARAVE|nr:hypothetical protein AVEN_108901-1 [Araneus ventricosus]GBO16449.1 hypothetical protein AVEN_114345-1 [Araneus ventricosus]